MEFVRQKVELCKFRASVSTSIFFCFHMPYTHAAGHLGNGIVTYSYYSNIHRAHTPQGIWWQGSSKNSKSYALHTHAAYATAHTHRRVFGRKGIPLPPRWQGKFEIIRPTHTPHMPHTHTPLGTWWRWNSKWKSP